MEKINSILLGLMFGCPFEDQKEDCPLNSLREREINDRFEYLKSLSKKAQDDLLLSHRKCLIKSENSFTTNFYVSNY